MLVEDNWVEDADEDLSKLTTQHHLFTHLFILNHVSSQTTNVFIK